MNATDELIRLYAKQLKIPSFTEYQEVLRQADPSAGFADLLLELMKEFLELGAIKVKSVDGQNADVGVVTTELNQTQSQTLKDDYYNAMLTICGMPNRNGGSSTSDTGSAVLLRDGWSDAEARAKDSENVFKRSEKKMLKLVLRICRDLGDSTLRLKDIDMKFTRRNYENIQSKSQVLDTMLKNPKIHPQLAFQHSGMFSDAESAYSMSMKYYEEQQEKAVELAQKTTPTENQNKNDPEDGKEDI